MPESLPSFRIDVLEEMLAAHMEAISNLQKRVVHLEEKFPDLPKDE